MLLPPHKATLRDWAQRMLNDPHTVVLDTETTGLGKEDEVLEIAILRLQSKRIMYAGTVEPYGMFFSNEAGLPENKRPLKGTEIHGLTEADISFVRLHDILRFVLMGRTIAYNSPFDSRLINQSFPASHAHLKPTSIVWECAMRAACEGYPELISPKTGRLSLQQLCGYLRVPQGGHTAYGDALATANLIHLWAKM